MSNTDFDLEGDGFKEGPSAPAVGTPASSSLETSVPETLTIDSKKVKTPDGVKIKTPLDIVGSISIRPYVDANSENMGLEKYGYVLFPGTAQEEQLAAIERNGTIQYITGLNEFAPEVQLIEDEEKKEAVIRNIRMIVSDLEKKIATNMVKPDDEEFWNKVRLLRPDKMDFWDKITIRCQNEPLYLDPKKDPYDLIKLMAIEAGGFSIIAKSYEDAQARAVPPKFYLDKEVDTVNTRTEYKKLKNRATGMLDEMYNKNPKKLLYVTKVVDAYSAKYKNSTPLDTLYDVMDEFIQGNGAEGNKTKAAQQFINAAGLDMETLKLKSLVKDASFYKFITPKPDGMIYHTKTGAMLGRNVADIVEFFKSPVNEDILGKIMNEVEQFWKQ
ncbi:hypothetical protein E6Q11_00455 [Candidatus Dojkabacteria bacterium]|uniref:Uncharacterized protein n=1 Tax=Candidatus Dojkabacteria bacterium TaxID=2099670 RepID=A0A5C7JB02_9BACT|nr:MAG: hypothetical protein E6Q11_00455 [Candidatus Dojkabacteria bacterium]